MKSKFSAIVLFSLLTLTGCTMRMVDFTLISTKNMDLSKADTYKRAKERVEGADEAMIIIFIPTGIPSIKEAVDRAIEQVPGGIALVDGVISNKSWWFLIGASSYVVEGTPLIDPALASNNTLKSNFMVAKLDKKGNIADFQYVDKEEYIKLRNKSLVGYERKKL